MTDDQKPDYAILRVEKVKTRQELKARSGHNNRTAAQGLEHTNEDGTIILLAGQDDANAAWDTKMAQAGIDPTKLRKDAVVGLEWLATSSPGWWEKATPEEQDEWVEQTMGFLTDQAGGPDNILSAHLHLDESTPHIQLLSIPITEKEVKARGRRKKGQEARKEVKTTLSANDYIGGSRNRLVELQTQYAAHVANLGLRRGIPRKMTGAKNMNPAKWRAKNAMELDEAERARKAAQAAEVAAITKERKAADTLEISEAEARRVITNADERAEALHIGFEAVDSGELAYQPASRERGERIAVRRAEKDSKLPPPGDPWTRFIAAVRPYQETINAYAKRLWALTQREAQITHREARVAHKEKALQEKQDNVKSVLDTIFEVMPDGDVERFTAAALAKQKARKRQRQRSR